MCNAAAGCGHAKDGASCARSGAPGFWIGNVIVMAGVPSIMQAMLDEVAPKLKISIRMLSETVRADVREGDIGMQLRVQSSQSNCEFRRVTKGPNRHSNPAI